MNSICDEYDFFRNYVFYLQVQTSRVVYSWNDNKPTDTNSISYHQQRGSTSINLLGGLPYSPDVPDDAYTFIIGVEDVCNRYSTIV